MPTRSKTCATYCRISYAKRKTARGTGDQPPRRYKSEEGVERQQADTDRLAKKLRYRVVERIVDNDRSASRRARRRREGFDRMLELVKSGAVDAVIVYDLDRFTRNPDELGPWIDAAELNPAVRIISTGDMIDLTDADSIFKARILLAVAEKESANIARRVKREARSAAEKGVPRWPSRPFGFNMDGSHEPVEAAELRVIYADVIGGKSMASIAKSLNERRIPNPSGARWQSATIGFLVRNGRNAGQRQYHGKVVGRGTWSGVVDEETWRQAVAALDARKAGRRQAARSLLGGVVRCAECKGAMHRSARAYRCLPRSDGYKTSCGGTIAGDRLDEYITGLVLAALGDVEPSRRGAKHQSADVDRLHGSVNGLQRDLEELAAMFGRGELGLAEYRAAKQPLDVRMASATAELTRTDARAALERMTGPTATLADRWDELDVGLKSRIVGAVFESIWVTKAQRPGQPFDPGRVDPRPA
jgi:DNA invertase Pin-like site-specific DNA recombinase